MQKLFDAIDEKFSENARVILAVAAVPTAGKSTITNHLLGHYGADAVALPMDGFHLDNAILDAKGLRVRKGSPESFDAAGFRRSVEAVLNGEEIYVPAFDRDLDLSRAAAIEIRDQKLVIAEGNYLLFDEAPWRDMASLWTLSVWLDISLEEVAKRAMARWLSYGLSQADAEARALGNDVPNAKRVMEHRLPADLTLTAEEFA